MAGINLTPDFNAYIRILNLIISKSSNLEDVEWALAEINRIGGWFE